MKKVELRRGATSKYKRNVVPLDEIVNNGIAVSNAALLKVFLRILSIFEIFSCGNLIRKYPGN